MAEAPSPSPPPAASFRSGCALCGLPPGRSTVFLDSGGQSLPFCCPGCRGVYQVLSSSPDGTPGNFRDTALYRACLESGIIPRSAPDPEASEWALPPPDAGDAGAALPLVLRIEGMWCPACSWLIEESLRRTGGIREAKVSFFADSAEIRYDPRLVTPREILGRISALGYRPGLFPEGNDGAEEKRSLVRLGISAILTFNIMMISFALYYGFFEDLEAAGVRFLSWPLFAMATPVVFYGGWPILKRGSGGLSFRAATMETLVLVGALSAYGYSFFRLLQGSLHLYFDTAAMIITLVSAGKYIELKARRKVSRGIAELYELSGRKVRVSPPLPAGPSPAPAFSGGALGEEGGERWIPAGQAKNGDIFFVAEGERIPLDARIVAGGGHVDESFLTGESKPVRKTPGDDVLAGSQLLDGRLSLRATRAGKEGSLEQLGALIREALSRKTPVEALADRITRRFVPAVLLIASSAGLFLWAARIPAEEAFLRALTVLLISCPCALGIAVPIAKAAAMGAGRSRGILIRDLSALQKIPDLAVWVFDKTGTLTEGRFELQDLRSAEDPREDLLSLLGAVESPSAHFVGRAIARKARETVGKMEPVSEFREFEGLGAQGTVAGKTVAIGSRLFMEDRELALPPRLKEEGARMERSGKTVVFFGWEKRVRGFAVLGDRLKPGSRKLIQDLNAGGRETWLLSGDSRETTRAVARELGIANYKGQASPAEKAALLRKIREKGRPAGMVGDGINDAAALAAADVGISLGSAENLAREAADLTLLTPDPGRILEARDLSVFTAKIIRQNLFFAFAYNVLAIPLAISGYLNPLIAVSAMFLSSLTVTGNALRIGRAGKNL